MASERMPQASIETALRRLELCAYAIQEIHTELEDPRDPDAKADLILATERLVSETIDFYATVRRYVWGEAEEQDFYLSSKDEEEN